MQQFTFSNSLRYTYKSCFPRTLTGSLPVITRDCSELNFSVIVLTNPMQCQTIAGEFTDSSQWHQCIFSFASFRFVVTYIGQMFNK